jgi:1-acyl-sn-glycerol-3-phosphate acyltransferase
LLYRHTLFNTPVITRLLRAASGSWLRLSGWTIIGSPPQAPRFVVIACPHTSNWDVPYTIAICLQFRLRTYWLGKSSLFIGPMGPVMRWLGGIPVELEPRGNLVQQLVQELEQADELALVISPEGNRSYVDHWKTGFYHIAAGAGIPVVLGFLDFTRKRGGYLGSYIPTGDVEGDIALMQAEYAGIRGRYPDQSRW